MKSLFPRITIKNALASLLFILVGMGVSLGVEGIRYTKYLEPSLFGMEPREVYSIISAQEPGTYLFLDVRSENEYGKIHAELSKNQPIHTLFDLWRDLPRDKDTKIYLICSGGRLAGVAYGFLQLHGFQNIVHVTGGIQSWTAQNQPTVSASLFPG
jgi:rhodanese-related sulfurtransferase